MLECNRHYSVSATTFGGSAACKRNVSYHDLTLFCFSPLEQVFAPLARLLGLYSIKEELEELSFRFSEPEKSAQLHIQLEAMRSQQKAGVTEARQALQALLEADPYLAARVERIQVECHSKALYSIWRCDCP